MSRPPLKDRNYKTGLVGLGPIPNQAPVAAFNIEGVENLLQTKSFEAIHYAHALIPDQTDLAGPINPNTQGAQRGVFYFEARKIGVVPTQFKLEDRLTVQGLWGIGSALFNVTGHYLDGAGEQAHIANRDLLVLPDVTIPIREKVEWNPTGPLKFQYRVRGVKYLADSKTLYHEGTDYVVIGGKIVWYKEGRKPSFLNGKGAILTAVYWATPIFIVQNMPHNLRIIPSNPQGQGAFPRDQVYAPQLLVVKPSTILEEKDVMDWNELPGYNDYPDSLNTTGGSV